MHWPSAYGENTCKKGNSKKQNTFLLQNQQLQNSNAPLPSAYGEDACKKGNPKTIRCPFAKSNCCKNNIALALCLRVTQIQKRLTQKQHGFLLQNAELQKNTITFLQMKPLAQHSHAPSLETTVRGKIYVHHLRWKKHNYKTHTKTPLPLPLCGLIASHDFAKKMARVSHLKKKCTQMQNKSKHPKNMLFPKSNCQTAKRSKPQKTCYFQKSNCQTAKGRNPKTSMTCAHHMFLFLELHVSRMPLPKCKKIPKNMLFPKMQLPHCKRSKPKKPHDLCASHVPFFGTSCFQTSHCLNAKRSTPKNMLFPKLQLPKRSRPKNPHDLYAAQLQKVQLPNCKRS